MAKITPIFKARNQLGIVAKLTVNGQFVPNEILRDMISVEFESELFQMDKLTVTLGNPSISRPSRFEEFFRKNDLLALYGGYGPGREEFMGAGIIDTFKTNFVDQRLILEAFDGGILLTRKKDKKTDKIKIDPLTQQPIATDEEKEDTETYPGLTEVEIAEQIAKEHGMIFDGPRDATTIAGLTSKDLVREEQTEYDFLRKLAAETSFVFFVDLAPNRRQWILHFHPFEDVAQLDNEQINARIFRWNAGDKTTILALDPIIAEEELEKEGFVRVVAQILNQRDQQTFEEKIFPKEIQVIRNKVFQTADQARRFTKALARTRNESFLLSTITVIGDQELKAGQVHFLEGLKTKYLKDLSGLYRFTSVLHSMRNRGGFTSRAEITRLEP